MPKSIVAGVAGSTRIRRLKGHELIQAENHGKRLDYTGKMRQVRESPAITTTGLDLVMLREEHVEGAMVPGSNTAALHMLVQFPIDLVEPDPKRLLRHARAFAESVFGPKAIFADRVDRDEKGQLAVDLFLAPRYTKKTKLAEKEAVSTSKHMKELAIERGLLKAYNEKKATRHKTPNLAMQGQALQTAFHEYLRDVAGVEGVQRGSRKRGPGDDWMPAEMLDIERRQEAVVAAEKGATAIRDIASRELFESREARKTSISEQEAATLARRHAEALQRGIYAFADGDIVEATERDGEQIIRYRDSNAAERIGQLITPAAAAVWNFVMEVAEPLRTMVDAATQDRELAAKQLEQAEKEVAKLRHDAEVAAAKINDEAWASAAIARDHNLALLKAAKKEKQEAEAAIDAAKKAHAAVVAERTAYEARMAALHKHGRDVSDYIENSKVELDQTNRAVASARSQAAAMITPQAIRKAAEAQVTQQHIMLAAERRVSRELLVEAIQARVTSAAVEAAARDMVTPAIVQQVLSGKVTMAQAARAAQDQGRSRWET